MFFAVAVKGSTCRNEFCSFFAHPAKFQHHHQPRALRRCPLSQRDADRAIRADIQFHAQQVSLVKRFLLLVRHHNPRVLQRRLHHRANVEWFRAFSRQLLIDLLLNCIDQRLVLMLYDAAVQKSSMKQNGISCRAKVSMMAMPVLPFSSITRKRTLSSWRIIAQ